MLIYLRAQVRETVTKKELYSEAFNLYVSDVNTPDLVAIARQLKLRAETLIAHAENSRWAERRAFLASRIASGQAEQRVSAQLAVDRQLVQSTVKAVEKWTGSLLEIIDRVGMLPTEPDASEVSGEEELIHKRSKLLANKLDLLKASIEGFREMTATTLNLGLLKARKGEPVGDESGKLDLSKLTTLNLAIVQASAGAMKDVTPQGAPAGLPPPG